MKIRIKGNSIRYRLTKTDVATFDRDGYLEEITSFGAQEFKYALKRSANAELTANFDNSCITIYMPLDMAYEWTNTDRIGFESTDTPLYLLIEKDFVCLDNVVEDQSDNYPHPAGVC